MTWLSEWGVTLAAGARSVVSGYTVVAADSLITVASTGGANPCLINLPAASARLTPLCIKNVGTVIISVVPNGTDTIDGQALFQIQKMIAPNTTEPTAFLVSDGTSAWHIVATHGMELGGGIAVTIPDMDYVYLTIASTPTLTTATPHTIVWDSEISDVPDRHSNSTNPTRIFTAPTGADGLYHITAQATFTYSSFPSAKTARLSLRLNGSDTIAKVEHSHYVDNNSGDHVMQVSGTFRLVEADYVEVIAYSQAAGAVTLTLKGGGSSADYYTWVSVAQVAAF
jgi:hypothetical protein